MDICIVRTLFAHFREEFYPKHDLKLTLHKKINPMGQIHSHFLTRNLKLPSLIRFQCLQSVRNTSQHLSGLTWPPGFTNANISLKHLTNFDTSSRSRTHVCCFWTSFRSLWSNPLACCECCEVKSHIQKVKIGQNWSKLSVTSNKFGSRFGEKALYESSCTPVCRRRNLPWFVLKIWHVPCSHICILSIISHDAVNYRAKGTHKQKGTTGKPSASRALTSKEGRAHLTQRNSRTCITNRVAF
jgi:hypothetical protein